MAEILTESFCERCGTRYTFQTAAPRRGRMARLRVATKGLRNYVLEDGSSLEDAFTEARNEEERSISGQQLEAFHKTFNFCLSCRQYTCANCWNTAENRCLTCAPDLSREVMPAPFPDLVPASVPSLDPTAERLALAQLAWPEADLGKPDDGVESTLAPDETGLLAAPAEAAGAPLAAAAVVEEAPVEAAEEAPAGAAGASVVPAAAEEIPAEIAATVGEVAPATAGAPVETAPLAPAAIAAAGIAAAAAAPEEPTVVEAAPAPAPVPSDQHSRIAAAAIATTALLGRFRPGQNIDAEIEAYERGEVAAAPAAAAGPEVVAAELASEHEPAAVVAAPIVAEPEAELVAETAGPEVAEARPEPLAAETGATAPPVVPEPGPAQPEPVMAEPAPRRDDRVEVPVWRIVAPESTPGATPEPTPPAWPPLPAPPAASDAPAWPTAPWALPAVPPTAERAREVMWAESSRDVVERAATGVQACVSCGLPLSATARFCRRCGSRQG